MSNLAEVNTLRTPVPTPDPAAYMDVEVYVGLRTFLISVDDDQKSYHVYRYKTEEDRTSNAPHQCVNVGRKTFMAMLKIARLAEKHEAPL